MTNNFEWKATRRQLKTRLNPSVLKLSCMSEHTYNPPMINLKQWILHKGVEIKDKQLFNKKHLSNGCFEKWNFALRVQLNSFYSDERKLEIANEVNNRNFLLEHRKYINAGNVAQKTIRYMYIVIHFVGIKTTTYCFQILYTSYRNKPGRRTN